MLKHQQQKIAENFAQNPVKHLLVDLDGTLLGNHAVPLGIDFMRRAYGLLKEYGSFRKVARTLMHIQREFTTPSSDLTNDLRVVELFSKQMNLSVEEGRRVLREGALLIFPDMRRHFYPIEGAKDFLDWAKERYPLTLATNPVWPPEIVELRVQWAGIDPKIFHTMTHIRKMRACKPAARYYQDILEEQKLRPEDCLLIGDNVKMDLPATRVGIRVFIVGKNSKLGGLRHTGAQAPAWRGTYPDLRRSLELARSQE